MSEMRICGKTFDEERALYGARSVHLSDCRFEGEADGESALKESADVACTDTLFALRYPLWHTSRASLRHIHMTVTCRAPLWYAKDVRIDGSRILGPKAVRECHAVALVSSEVDSEEFGWLSSELLLEDSSVKGMYAFFHSKNITAKGLRFEGKYSFQYVENVTISNARLCTKDAFWHAKNVTVTDSVIEGEYLGWYAENLRLIRCHIKGTQPLCYTKGLYMEDCTMEGCDLAFEKSEVDVTVKGRVDSVKAPAAGIIRADEICEILPQNDGSMGGATVIVGKRE